MAGSSAAPPETPSVRFLMAWSPALTLVRTRPPARRTTETSLNDVRSSPSAAFSATTGPVKRYFEPARKWTVSPPVTRTPPSAAAPSAGSWENVAFGTLR